MASQAFECTHNTLSHMSKTSVPSGTALLHSRIMYVYAGRLLTVCKIMSLHRSQDSIGTVASGADAMACEVLSAGGDKSLRMFHTALDRQNRELSQGERVRCILYALVCVVVCVFSYIFSKDLLLYQARLYHCHALQLCILIVFIDSVCIVLSQAIWNRLRENIL